MDDSLEQFEMTRLSCIGGASGTECRFIIAAGAKKTDPASWVALVFHCETHDDDYYAATAEDGSILITHIATAQEVEKVN